MKWIQRFIAFSMLFSSCASFAWIQSTIDTSRLPKEISSLALSDQLSYQFVTDVCESSTASLDAFDSVFEDTQDQTRSMILKLNFQHLATRYQMDGLSPKLNLLLHSYGYYLGLQKCFGDDNGKKNKLTLILIAGDLAGDTTGLAQGALVWIGVPKLLRWLATFYKPVNVAITAGAAVGGAALIRRLYQNLRDRAQEKITQKASADDLIQDYKSVLAEEAQVKNSDPSSPEIQEIENLKQSLEQQAKDFGVLLPAS